MINPRLYTSRANAEVFSIGKGSSTVMSSLYIGRGVEGWLEVDLKTLDVELFFVSSALDSGLYVIHVENALVWNAVPVEITIYIINWLLPNAI